MRSKVLAVGFVWGWCCHHIHQAWSTLLLSQPAIPIAITPGEREAFSSQLTAGSLIPVTLRGTAPRRRELPCGSPGGSFLLELPPPSPKSSFFSNWKTVRSETVWAQGFGYRPTRRTKSTTEGKQRYNFGLLGKRMQNPEAESLGALDRALCEWILITNIN